MSTEFFYTGKSGQGNINNYLKFKIFIPACTVAILVRDDVVTTYEKVLMSLGHAPNIRLRLCLDALDYLSRNSKNL